MGRNDPPLTTVEGILYRYSNYDTPFWARANTRAGRWHAAGDGPTQYLSMSTDGSWADLIRHEELRSEDELALVRMPLWQVKVDVSNVVDYSDFKRCEDAGFAPKALIDDDWKLCQGEGARLRRLGYAGVLAPSAALPGELNLTLFGPRVAIDWGAVPSLASAIPAKVLTIGSPPPTLLDKVRYKGQSHAAFEEFLKLRRSRRRPK